VLPLAAVMAKMINDLTLGLPDKQIYPMLSAKRYAMIMERKRQGRLTDRLRKCPDEYWSKQFRVILDKVGITAAKFHNLRSTCLTEWLEGGLEPHEVKELAGHADIKTTINYYTAVRDEVVDRARTASEKCLVETGK
jgi:integrase